MKEMKGLIEYFFLLNSFFSISVIIIIIVFLLQVHPQDHPLQDRTDSLLTHMDLMYVALFLICYPLSLSLSLLCHIFSLFHYPSYVTIPLMSLSLICHILSLFHYPSYVMGSLSCVHFLFR